MTVSHLKIITYVVKPMATLVITRRLYLILSQQSVKFASKAAVRNVTASFYLSQADPYTGIRDDGILPWNGL